MSCYNRKLRLALTGLLITIGLGSLFTNIYYVYKFGPPYQSADNGARSTNVKIFSPIAALRHKANNRIRRSLENAPSTAISEHKVTSSHEKPVTDHDSITKDTTDDSKLVKMDNHSQASHDNSFILAASYSDTISSLPKSLLQLGQFAKDLGIHDIVAPWVFGYRVYGIKRLVASADKGQNSLAFNRLYDLKSVNNLMAQCSGTTVTLFTDFIKEASRNVTMIYFVRKNFIEPRQFHLLKEDDKVLTEEFKKAQVFECSSLVKSNSQTTGKDLADALNAELTGDNSKAFHISSIICVDNSKIVKTEVLNDFIRSQGSNNNTIVLLNWRGHASLIKKPYDSSKYWIQTWHTFPGDKCHHTVMPFHFEVPRAAHQFLSHNGISGKNYVSIYISFEYLARLNNTAYADCCLKETNRVIGSLITKYHVSQVLIIGDHTKQSSSYCDNECVKRSVAMVTKMASWGLNVTRFNPDVTTAKHHHLAYNMLAEITLLSTGNKLIMVGQNVWHSQIKTSFIQHYPTDGITKLYAICISTGTYLRDLGNKKVQCKEKN